MENILIRTYKLPLDYKINRKLVAISIGILFVLSLNTVAAMNEREPEIGINYILEGEAAINFKIPNFFNYDEY